MRALFDTNVLVSAILFGGRPRALLQSALRGEVHLVTSQHLLNELEGLLSRKFGFSEASASAIRSELESISEVVTPTSIPHVCRDEDDNHVLAAAAAGQAACIVTGDVDLLVLASFESITIVTPADFDQ